MKQSRILVISIIIADLVLAAVCMIAYSREDRTRPEFRFQTDEYIYTGRDGEDKLLESITAYDDRDGDISERIVIEKITENREASTIVVYYAVSDSAGNVAKISRVFVADFREQGSPGGEGVEAPDGAPEDKGLSMEGAPGLGDAGEDGASGGTDGEDGTGDGAPGGTDETGEEDGAGDSTPGGTDGAEGNAGQEPPAAAGPEAQGPAAGEGAPVEDRSGHPVLTLRTDEVTIAAGTSPPWTEIIETLRDDKDDYATLYYNLSVSRFNRDQAGDYPVSLYTEDSDGNRSETVTVTVHVR